MSSDRPRAAAPVVTATLCAFAMIATQVAGKAARDALFLTHFDISALPTVLVASALVSIGVVLLTARAMAFYGPQRVVPPFFLLSGVLLVAEWLVAARDPRLASVLVYLHIAVIGSILISGFWSIVNERFDPRTARQRIDRIVGGATAGGLFGGLLAERVGVEAGILWVLPIIAAFHLACAFLLRRLGAPPAATARPPLRSFFARSEPSRPVGEGFRVLRRVAFLRDLALVVLLGNVAATFVDFLFKARAVETFAGGDGLVRFFAVFYTLVSLVTLAVQTGLTRRLIQRFGVARTMTVRPALLAAGGLATLPFMGLAGLGILRGLEAVVQGSLFRSAYELTFTPVAPGDKRASKTLIDVGVDRMGDTIGAVVVRAVILLPAAAAGHVLLVLAVALSVVGMLVARALHMGYVRALEASLIDRAHALDIHRTDAADRATMMDSLAGIDLSMSLHGINLEELREATRSVQSPAPPSPAATHDAVPAPRTRPAAPIAVRDPEVLSLIELRSGDPKRVHAQLRQLRSPSPVIAAQLIALLAWDDVAAWAARVLAKAAPSLTGQLIDRLLDPDEDFAVRRRIPSILATNATARVQDGLIAALADGRFEVRYQTARALARMHERVPGFVIDRAAVYVAVLREARVDPQLWANQRLLDEPPVDDGPPLADGSHAPRANRSLEHVFTMLSLVLPKEPLHIAFKGLLTTDDVLRGTSLEYLESVLPRDAWEALRPFLHDTRAIVANPRPHEEVLDALLRSSQSIELNLSELRKPAGS